MELHPPLVHFPIAFCFLELLLLILWQAKKDPAYLRFARFSFGLGYLFMLIAMGAGFVDAGGFRGITGKVRIHVFSALGVFGISTIRALLWRFSSKENPSPAILITSALILNLLVTVTAFLGGTLVD